MDDLRDVVTYQSYTLGELETSKITMLDKIIHQAFKHPVEQMNSPYLSNFAKDTIVSVIMLEHKPIGVAVGEQKHYKIDPHVMSATQVLVHSIAIDPTFQGKKLCKDFVKSLLHEIETRYGKVPMHLNVRVSKDNPNVGAIRCYENNGFRLVDVPPISREDGPNAYMVRDYSSKPKDTSTPTKKKRSNKKKKSKKKRKKKK